MPISTTCPHCKALFRLAEALAGKKVKCQKCQSIFTVPSLDESASPGESSGSSGNAPPSKKTTLGKAPPRTKIAAGEADEAETGIAEPSKKVPRKRAVEEDDEEDEDDEDEKPRSRKTSSGPPPVARKKSGDRSSRSGRRRESKPASNSGMIAIVSVLLGGGLLSCCVCGGVGGYWFLAQDRPPVPAIVVADGVKRMDGLKIAPPPDAGNDRKKINTPPPAGGNMVMFGIDGSFRTDSAITPLDLVQQFDPLFGPKRHKVYLVPMEVGKTYQIDLMSQAFDSFLHLSDDRNFFVARDDDGGEGLNSRIIYRPTRAGVHRIYATTLTGQSTGNFTLTVRRS